MSDKIVMHGIVTEMMRNAMFWVTLDNGHKVLAHTSGKMRMRHIRILVGDRVSVEMSKYDLKKARIIYRDRFYVADTSAPTPAPATPGKTSAS